MTWIAVGVGGVSAITSGIGMIGAGKQKKRIAREIANQKEVPLTNIADGMQVSTRGADLEKQQQAQLAATQTDALADGGTRALVGGIGRVSAESQNVNARIGANLDEQQNNINNVRAQDEARIQTVKEQRQNAKLAALSSQYNAANQTQATAMGNIAQSAGMAGNALAASGKLDTKEKPNSINRKVKIKPTSGNNIYAYVNNDTVG